MSSSRTICAAAVALAAIAGGGCASSDGSAGGAASVTASEPSRFTRSGFLSDYGRLNTAAWGDGIECWRNDDLNARSYDKALVGRILVSLKPDSVKTIDPSDLKTLTDYFHSALVASLKRQMQVVDQPGPGVVVIRIALTDLVPTSVARSVGGTLVPYGFVAEASSGVASGRPAGATPYLGETSVEMQFVDGANEAVLGECRDTEIGRKYAADLNAGGASAAQTWASGYLNSFSSWSYAKNAFDKWALQVAARFAALRREAPGR